MDRSLGEYQSRAVHFGKVKNFLTLPGNQTTIPRVFSPYPSHYTGYAVLLLWEEKATELYVLEVYIRR
jgi:hypothetical protein